MMFQMLAFTLIAGAAPEEAKSGKALADLTAELSNKSANLTRLVEKDFAKVPLTKADAAKAREAIWNAYAAARKLDRVEELKAKKLTIGKLEMPFDLKVYGKAPAGEKSLWIAMHGGGNTTAAVNDRSWKGFQTYYTVEEGIYVSPRAPTNTWNMWHEAHVDQFFARLIEDFVTVEGVNPDKVYLLGYSAGGDGAYQMAPRMADRWAAAAMMAGHPNDASPLNLRNVPFTLHMGADDSAYNRNKVILEWGSKLDELEKADPQGYKHLVKVYPGKGHNMQREEKIALPWMAKFTRNPIPDTVVWKQAGTTHDRSYWLAVPPRTAKGGSLVTATRNGNTMNVTAVENVSKFMIRFDDRMQDLDRPVVVNVKNQEKYTGQIQRTIGTLLGTLVDSGDPKLMFDGEIDIEIK